MLAQRSGLSSSSEVNDLPVLTQTHNIWKPNFTAENFENKIQDGILKAGTG